MAFLRKFPRSPYWFAGYTAPDGRRVQRSTKQSRHKQAQLVANEWEKAARLAAEKRLGEAQARRIISDIYAVVSNEPLRSAVAQEFLMGWAEKRKVDTALRTHQAYAQVARDFIKSLGARASMDISQLTKTDVIKYRDEVLARTSIATANKSLKYLRVALNAAYKDGVAQDNPAAKVDVIRRRLADITERRPFTVKEIKTIMTHASGEWKGLILFGLYTGQRLKDIARLTWHNIDTENEELRFVTAKTGRRMSIPLAAPLLALVQSLPAGDDPSAPLFPDAYAIASKEGSDSRLSQQFQAILVLAGMANERSKDATGKGRSIRRAVSDISFHSLRHTATSMLKNAGVPEAVVMDIIGHDSEVISRHYTHIESKAKRAALRKLPDLD
ncbi:MAG TPA: tyrosine-type recombinase/integrase [Opitutaceae bacterium]|nr:tyrosine-type recombinase/integrase [Opitutaceae bacterium]